MDAATLAQYDAVVHAVGLIDLSDRGKLEVTGPDRVSFLHSMISNDVEGLPDYEGHYGTFLTARGKIVSDFYYYRFPEFLLLDIDRSLLDKTLSELGKYIIMEEVDLSDASAGYGHFSLQGPRSPKLLQDLFGEARPQEVCGIQPVGLGDGPVWLIRRPDLADEGFELVFPAEMGSDLRASIQEKGAVQGIQELEEKAWNVLRTEAWIPRFGIDMDETRYPMEARLDQAISLTKGCYLGQEVVAKATHIGGVNNLLMGLKLDGGAPPERGARVVSEEGKEIGAVTSAVFSPRMDCPIAFAYLKRGFASAGNRCRVELAAGESASAEIVERFLSLRDEG